jgi:hypothetical protein
MRIVLAVALLIGCEGSGPALVDGAGATFACGSASCEMASQFCYQLEAGRVPTAPVTVAPETGCNPLPAGCGSCGCVLADDTFSCGAGPTCFAQGSAITVTCPGI